MIDEGRCLPAGGGDEGGGMKDRPTNTEHQSTNTERRTIMNEAGPPKAGTILLSDARWDKLQLPLNKHYLFGINMIRKL